MIELGLNRTKCYSMLLAICLLAYFATNALAEDLAATYPGAGLLTVTGTWRFHTGDDLRWRASGFDDSGWESLSADATWGAQTHRGYTGLAWYRSSIDIASVAGPLSIYLPAVDGSYELYWNGLQIGAIGRLPPHAAWFRVPSDNIFPLPKPDTAGHLKGTLAVRIWEPMVGSTESADRGGLTAPPQIGDPGVLSNALFVHDVGPERVDLLMIVEDSVFFLVALGSIGMWVFDRNHRLQLWLGVFLLGFGAQIVFFLPAFYRHTSILPEQIYEVLWSAANDLGSWMLFLVLFGLDRDRVWRRTTAVLAAIYLTADALDLTTVVFWPSGWSTLRLIDAITSTITSILPVYLFVLLVAGLRRRRDFTLIPTACAAAALQSYNIFIFTLSQNVQFTHIDWQKLLRVATISIGPYDLNFNGQLEAIVLIVLVVTVYREHLRERKRQQFIEAELRSAREIQSVLVPEDTPSVPGFAISSLYWPAGEVGGDMFQVIPGPSGDILIILADVSGKGLKAAMTVSLLVGAVRTVADTNNDPLKILAVLNQRLIGRSHGGFSTCLALHVSASGLATVANAGHLPPYLNGEAMPLEGSLPLGIVPSIDFPVTVLQLNEGDDLVLYTDGVPEAQTKSGELFGFDRTAALLKTRPAIRTVAETARNFGQNDDITVVKVIRTSSESNPSQISVDLYAADS